MKDDEGTYRESCLDISTQGQELPLTENKKITTPKNKKSLKNLRKIKHFLDKHPQEIFTLSEIAKKTKTKYGRVHSLYKQGELREYEGMIKTRNVSDIISDEEIIEEKSQEEMQQIFMEGKKEREETNKEMEKTVEKETLGGPPIENNGEIKTIASTATVSANIPMKNITKPKLLNIVGTPEIDEIPKNIEEDETMPVETEEEDFKPTNEEIGGLIPEDKRKKVDEPKDKIALSNTVQMPIGCSTEVWTITGRRSSGKSFSVGKIAEELKRLGVQFIVLDVRGAHSAISMENVKQLTIMPGKTVNMKHFVNVLKMKPWISVILNLKNLPLKEQEPIIRDYCEEMLLADFKRPTMTVFEECQDFIPLKRRTEASDSVIRYIKLGRSSGGGVILVTQRPASASKEALSQSGIYIVHKVINTKDLQALEDLISFGLRKDKEIVREILSKVTQFSPGEMVIYAPDYIEENNGVLIGKTGKRRTMHAGVNVPVVPRDSSSGSELFDETAEIPSENIHYPGKEEEDIVSDETGGFDEEETDEELETDEETEKPEKTTEEIMAEIKDDETFKGAIGIIGGVLAALGTYLGLKHFVKK